jgi:hypothetical protein
MTVIGLTKEQLERPTLTGVNEVFVHDEEGGFVPVHVGDQVEIFEPTNNKSTLEYLGPGPYTIEWLARWRCGRGFLQLTTPTKGSGKGVNADKIKIVQ